MTETTGRAGGVTALLGASTLFSWGFIIAKSIPLPPPTIAMWRLLIGAVVLGTAGFAMQVGWPTRWRTIIAAGVFFGLHQLCYVAAIKVTSVATVALVGAMMPLIVAISSRRLLAEPLPKSYLLWAVIGIAGVVLVVTARGLATRGSIYGLLLAVINLLLVSGYFLLSKRARMDGAHTVTVTAGVLASSLLVVIPTALYATPTVPMAASSWWMIALLALGPGNGHLLMNWAHARVTAALSSLVLSAVPLLASLWAHLVLGEPYGVRHVVGAVLVAVAVEGARRAEP